MNYDLLVLFLHFSNKLLMGYIDSIELNQTWNYLLNMHWKVHKEHDAQSGYTTFCQNQGTYQTL